MLYTPLMSATGFGVAAPCFAMKHEYAVGKSLIVLVAPWLAMAMRCLVNIAQDDEK